MMTLFLQGLRLQWRSPGKRFASLVLLVVALAACHRSAREVAARQHAERDAMAREADAPILADKWVDGLVRQGKWLYLRTLGAAVLSDGAGARTLPFEHVRAGIAPAHKLDLSDGAAAWTPETSRFGSLDPAFVLVVLAPLWVLFLGHDVVGRERERGTLKVLLAHGVSRAQLVLARLFAIFVSIAVGLMGLTLAAAAFARAAGVEGPLLPRLSLGALVAFTYLAAHAAIAVLASIGMPSTRGSLSALVLFWILGTFVVPRAAATVAATTIAVPLPAEHKIRKRAALADAKRLYVEEGHAADDLTWQKERLLVGARALRTEAAIETERAERRTARQSLEQRLALPSLASTTSEALADLAGTSFARDARFRHAVMEHRHALTLHGAGALERHEDGARVLATAPAFVFTEEREVDVLGRVLPKAAWMLVVGLLAAIGALRAIRSYDAR